MISVISWKKWCWNIGMIVLLLISVCFFLLCSWWWKVWNVGVVVLLLILVWLAGISLVVVFWFILWLRFWFWVWFVVWCVILVCIRFVLILWYWVGLWLSVRLSCGWMKKVRRWLCVINVCRVICCFGIWCVWCCFWWWMIVWCVLCRNLLLMLVGCEWLDEVCLCCGLERVVKWWFFFCVNFV